MMQKLSKHSSIVLLTWVGLIYWRVYDYSFLLWDDNSHVYANPLLNPLTFSSLSKIWMESYRGFYIPVTYTFWAGLGYFFGFQPHVFHIANVALHFWNACLLYGLLRYILQNSSLQGFVKTKIEFLALLGAGIFAVHPVQVESVTWVTGAKDLLPTFLSLLALKYYFSKTGHLKKNKITSTLFFLLAVLAKPAVIGLPVIVFCLNYFFLRKSFQQSIQGLLPWAAMSFAVALLTKALQPDSMVERVAPYWLRPMVMGDTFSFYLYQFVAPFHLAPVYERTPEYLMKSGSYIYALILPLVLFGFAAVLRKSKPWILGSLMIYSVAIIPVSGIVPFIFQNFSTVADHYLYFPMIGLVLGMVFILASLPVNQILFTKLSYGMSFVLLVLMIKSSLQISIWEKEDTFFQYAEANAPQTAILEGNYGISLFNREQYTEALKHFYRATVLKKDPVYYNDVGSTWIKLGNREKGKEAFLQGLAIHPKDEVIQENLKKLGL